MAEAALWLIAIALVGICLASLACVAQLQALAEALKWGLATIQDRLSSLDAEVAIGTEALKALNERDADWMQEKGT